MREWHRTVILLLLLALAIGYLIWSQYVTDVNFTQGL